ncbi:MAG: demethoxyubiquinone hydroxylase family protein [Alphaproteobacteria bacterium]
MSKRARRKRPRHPGARGDSDILEMIRVDHAGEYGAMRIYEGQLAVLERRARRASAVAAIRHMAAEERAHLEKFERLINERGVRPTALVPVWHAAGFALGAATALMGEKAAMACTAAVEEAIDAHYADQAQRLGTRDPGLRKTIEKCREEELAHRDEALARGAEEAPAYGVLSRAIKLGCRVAIRLSEKI